MDPARTIKLLYVEDDQQHAEMIIDMLHASKHIKFDIDYKGDLQSSIAYLNDIDCNIDAVLLDLMLPNSEGVETFEAVYNACVSVPVVIISAHEDIACKCISLGAQDYLVKPDITPHLISRSIKYAIERKKLQIQEKKYELLVEATNAGIYEIDFVNDRFTYVNDVMCKLTGWSREELMSMGPSHLLTEKSLNDWAERWAALNRGEYIDKTFEYEAKIKNGSTIWTLVTAEFKENKEGVVVGARVVAIDITAKKLIEEKAKTEEKIMFNKLEKRIHIWREEINLNTIAHENKLRAISLNINSMSISEVH
jgi:PAS domain S-box-containing protein